MQEPTTTTSKCPFCAAISGLLPNGALMEETPSISVFARKPEITPLITVITWRAHTLDIKIRKSKNKQEESRKKLLLFIAVHFESDDLYNNI